MNNGNATLTLSTGITVDRESDDRVIRSLSSALETAEQGRDRYCAEALRLAIAVRLAGLQSGTRTSGETVRAEARGRQIRALQRWRLKRVVEYIDTQLSNKIRLVDLAAVAGLSRMHFASQFRTATGLRPHEFLLRRRILRAEELLRNSPMAIVEIALTVGFQTQAHFTTVFKRFVGCTPGQWRMASQMPGLPPGPRSRPSPHRSRNLNRISTPAKATAACWKKLVQIAEDRVGAMPSFKRVRRDRAIEVMVKLMF
jgi:AraC-like DNA-binding protein